MRISKKHWFVIAGILIVAALAAGAWQYFVKASALPLPLRPGDTIASWDFKGAYAGDTDLISQANADIARLKGLIGGKTENSYNIYTSLAGEYDLLGDGKNEFTYLEKAIVAGPTGGVAWNNLGVLMERLGALNTARAAYEQAVKVEPNVPTYQESLLQFLTTHVPSETTTIEAAFQAGIQVSGDPNLLPIQAAWLASIGSTTAAIAAWRQFSTYVPAAQQAAIAAEIAKLEAKQ